MKLSSLFLSLLLALLPLAAGAQTPADGRGADVVETAPTDAATPSALPRYSLQIERGRSALTGMLICTMREGQLLGSVVNEFGFSPLQFTYTPESQKLKLVYVADFLNKWYIRRILTRDLRFCLHTLYGFPLAGKQPYELTRSDDTVTVVNPRRKLRYTFSPLPTLTHEHESEQ